MNMYRTPLLLLITLLFLAPAVTLPAQDPPAAEKPEAKKDPTEKKDPAEKKATTANASQVSLTDKEIEKVAKALAEVEKWEEKGKLVKQAAAWKKLEALLETIRKSKREPLAAVESWSMVFCSEKYRRFGGRGGRQRNKKLQFQMMGRVKEVVCHADVPGVYRAKTPIPLVLGLSPTKGKFRGEEFLRQLWGDKELQTAIVVAPEFPGKFVKEEGSSWSARRNLWASVGVIGQLTRDYNVAFDRFFLDGYGEGAPEVWRVASCLADTYAGLIVRGALPPDDTRLEDFRNSAVLLIGIPGAEMTPEKADALGARMKALDIDVTVANLSEAPKKRKESAAFEAVTPAIVAFLQKRRPRHPDQLDWSVKLGHTRRNFFAMSLREIEDEAIADEKERAIKPNFQVKVDRENNKLVVTAHRIVGLKFWLNDAILDLDKDVTVEVNGKALFNGRPKRSLKYLYEGVIQGGDWTRIFVCDVAVEVPQPEKPEKPEKKGDEGEEKKGDEKSDEKKEPVKGDGG